MIQDAENVGWGSGSARMFPNQGPLGLFGPTDQGNYPYNFGASLAGIAYSEFLFPDISKVSPAVGSVAGGTLVTISGSGFSKNLSRNIVYVGGELCTVTASDFGYIQCITSSISPANISSFEQGIQTGNDGIPGRKFAQLVLTFYLLILFNCCQLSRIVDGLICLVAVLVQQDSG